MTDPHTCPSAPILVTGASTGIGHHLAVRLAAIGCQVYATARRPADLDRLAAIPGVHPIELDLRDRARIRDAVLRVEAEGRGLYGLVNNAGIGGIGPIATWSDDELDEILEVNLVAPVRLVRAFLPLLLRARGRIVNIGSQGGSISMRYFGPYTMTKHAMEAFTVALREEVQPHGLGVSIVQPGGIVSAIGENAREATLGRFRRAEPPFDEEARGVLESLEQPPSPEREDEPESAANRKPSHPEIVAVAVIDALFAPEPRPRYLVGTRWEGDRVLRALMDRILDANDCPTLGYSRAELLAQFEARAAERGH